MALIRGTNWLIENLWQWGIELNQPPPLLVVKIISTSTRSTDYRAKHAEYTVLGISEYWIVDSEQNKVTVLNLVDAEYVKNEQIGSTLFPELNLTAAEVFDS